MSVFDKDSFRGSRLSCFKKNICHRILKFLFDRIVKSLIIVSETLQVAIGVIYQFVSCNEVSEPSIVIFFKYL